MTVEIKRIKATDFKYLQSKGATSAFIGSLSPLQEQMLEAAPYAHSVFLNGALLFCAGVTEYWPGRAEAWAVLNPEFCHLFHTITRVVKRYLNSCPVRRIEAAVEVSAERAHRWVEVLGFQLECPRCEAFLPSGEAASLYSMVKKGVA
jgi:hypothetical protein